ncbi:LysE family translocator [Roseovarius aquimarinus]|uniref:LysE family translocator n=1 Tax=Roseovarius aquimarinus TaxID=1229156 RepID=A0ABW7I6I7_9RHOB
MNLEIIDLVAAGAFTLAAIGLLGSPGPAIAALLAVGKTHGLGGGLRFYGGLQIGLATAAAISAAGFVSLIVAVPATRVVMIVVATAYLLYLAYKIATAPVRAEPSDAEAAAPKGGFALAGAVVGITNPKAYVAFASLMAPVTLVASTALGDGILKWLLVVLVMIVVDILWLLAGVALGRASLPPSIERGLNYILAAMIVAAAGLAFL